MRKTEVVPRGTFAFLFLVILHPWIHGQSLDSIPGFHSCFSYWFGYHQSPINWSSQCVAFIIGILCNNTWVIWIAGGGIHWLDHMDGRSSSDCYLCYLLDFFCPWNSSNNHSAFGAMIFPWWWTCHRRFKSMLQKSLACIPESARKRTDLAMRLNFYFFV